MSKKEEMNNPWDLATRKRMSMTICAQLSVRWRFEIRVLLHLLSSRAFVLST